MNEINNQENTLYKLMILYMLKNVNYALASSRLSDFLLGKGYTNWFMLESSLGDLEEADLIHPETIRNMSYYAITPEGEKTITLFSSRIPTPIREDIDAYLSENKIKIINETSALSDFYRNTRGGFNAHCMIREKEGVILDLTISVEDEAQAQAICANWADKSQEIYAGLIAELMKEP